METHLLQQQGCRVLLGAKVLAARRHSLFF